MIHSTLINQPPPLVTNPGNSPVTAHIIKFQNALHDINNLLMIMSTYTGLAVNKLPVDSPVYEHMSLAEEAVSQAALFAHELRTELK